MELGYKGDKAIYQPTKHGPWKHCDEDTLRRIVGDNSTNLKLAVMADADRTNYRRDILPKSESVIDMIRVACYINQVPLALDMVKDAADKGYEVMLQIMALSTISEGDLEAALKVAGSSDAGGVYIVDSFGALYGEQVRDLTKMYLAAMQGTGKEVGFHGHNNCQLAFANSVEAVIAGANRVDATIMGLGRGAGNCPLELLVGFLHNPKFSLRPVLECCRDVMLPLRAQYDWGYSIPYAITAQLKAAGVMNMFPHGVAHLVTQAAVRGRPWHVASFAVYGTTLAAMFLFSALHHGLRLRPRAAVAFRVLDYCAVFLLIAGTFTPICLVALRGPFGWCLFGVAWAVAAIGITLRSAAPATPKWVTSTLFISMGWLGAAAALAWLIAGGVLYSAGLVIYALEKPNPCPGVFGFHEIWHLAVIAGAAAHYTMMARNILPLP